MFGIFSSDPYLNQSLIFKTAFLERWGVGPVTLLLSGPPTNLEHVILQPLLSWFSLVETHVTRGVKTTRVGVGAAWGGVGWSIYRSKPWVSPSSL